MYSLHEHNSQQLILAALGGMLIVPDLLSQEKKKIVLCVRLKQANIIIWQVNS